MMITVIAVVVGVALVAIALRLVRIWLDRPLRGTLDDALHDYKYMGDLVFVGLDESYVFFRAKDGEVIRFTRRDAKDHAWQMEVTISSVAPPNLVEELARRCEVLEDDFEVERLPAVSDNETRIVVRGAHLTDLDRVNRLVEAIFRLLNYRPDQRYSFGFEGPRDWQAIQRNQEEFWQWVRRERHHDD